MAKNLDIFKRTDKPRRKARGRRSPEPGDPVKTRGIGLRVSEWEALDKIAQELGVNTNGLAIWILLDFLKRYEAGYRPETETKTVLKT